LSRVKNYYYLENECLKISLAEEKTGRKNPKHFWWDYKYLLSWLKIRKFC